MLGPELSGQPIEPQIACAQPGSLCYRIIVPDDNVTGQGISAGPDTVPGIAAIARTDITPGM